MPVIAVADNGTLAFAPGYLRWSRREPMQVVRVSGTGVVTPLPLEPDLFFRGFELSPDGGRLAVGMWDGSQSIFDLRRGTRQKVPPGTYTDVNSLSWHPDGRRIAGSGLPPGSSAWSVAAESLDGNSKETLIVVEPQREVFTAGWLPDGRGHIGWTNAGLGTSEILRKDEGQAPRAILSERGTIRSVQVSPDGRWLAYESSVSGPFHVYVTSITGKGERLQVSPRSVQAIPVRSGSPSQS
jgi:WD40 repeat protein